MITNIMKQKMLGAVKNTKRVELLGASNEVLSSKEVSWNTSIPTQSYINLTPISIASGADNVPEKVRLVTGMTVDFEAQHIGYSSATVYEPYMEDIISKNYPTGTIVGQTYQRGNTVYPFRVYKADPHHSELMGIEIRDIEFDTWDESTDIEELYSILNIEGIYMDDYANFHRIVTEHGYFYYVSVPARAAFPVKDKATTLTYNISDYTSSQLNYPEGVQIDINSLREEL